VRRRTNEWKRERKALQVGRYSDVKNLDHEIDSKEEEEHPRAVIPEEGIPPLWYFLRRARGTPNSRYKSTGITAVDIIPRPSFKQSSFQEWLSSSIISGSQKNKFDLLFIGPSKWTFRSDPPSYRTSVSTLHLIYSGKTTRGKILFTTLQGKPKFGHKCTYTI
jgi:hypothetical protein